MNEENYFDSYWQAVARLLNCNPKQKTSAIRLGAPETPPIDGVALVRELMAVMSGARWREPASASGGNWAWRSELSDHSTLSPEVVLERAVVALGGVADWTYQMPTSSGLHGSASGKRRSIDLVRRRGADHYALVELKVNSDQPLYAAFEILGYGLAYLHARRNGQRGSGLHDVMTARRIDLVVLGPHDWYAFITRSGERHRFALAALAAAIESGLAPLLRELPDVSPEVMRFQFSSFGNATTSAAAAEIVREF